jgi:hypothetical protein
MVRKHDKFTNSYSISLYKDRKNCVLCEIFLCPWRLNGDFRLNHDFYKIYRMLKRKNHPDLDNLFNLIEITVQTFLLTS